MTMLRRFSIACGSLITVMLVTPALVGRAQQNAPRPPLIDKDHLRMDAEAGLAGGPVFGDQAKPGMYVIRNRFAAGNTSRPHYHDQDRWVTVIKGTWWTGEGDVFQPDKMVPIKAGGMMFHPAGFHHYDGAKDEDTVVQIMGMGPVKTIQTEVDANGKPVTGRGGRGN